MNAKELQGKLLKLFILGSISTGSQKADEFIRKSELIDAEIVAEFERLRAEVARLRYELGECPKCGGDK